MLGVLGIFKAKGTAVFNEIVNRPAEIIGGSVTSITAVKCTLNSQAYGTFLMNMFAPFAILAIAALFMIPTKAIDTCVKNRRMGKVPPTYKGVAGLPRCFTPYTCMRRSMTMSDTRAWSAPIDSAPRLVAVLVFTLFTLYPTLVSSIAKIVNCSNPIGGKSYLLADLTVTCYEGWHNAYLALAAICFVVYCGGIPVVVFAVSTLKTPCVCRREKTTLWVPEHDDDDDDESRESSAEEEQDDEGHVFAEGAVVAVRVDAEATEAAAMEERGDDAAPASTSEAGASAAAAAGATPVASDSPRGRRRRSPPPLPPARIEGHANVSDDEDVGDDAHGATGPSWWWVRYHIIVGRSVYHPFEGHGIVVELSPGDDNRVHVEYQSGEVHRYSADAWKATMGRRRVECFTTANHAYFPPQCRCRRRPASDFFRPSVRRRYGFLFHGYESDGSVIVIGWEANVMLRKLLVTLAGAGLSDPYLQIIAALMILIASFGMQVRVPHRRLSVRVEKGTVSLLRCGCLPLRALAHTHARARTLSPAPALALSLSRARPHPLSRRLVSPRPRIVPPPPRLRHRAAPTSSQTFFKPYEPPALDVLDSLGLFALLCTQILSILYLYTETSDTLSVNKAAVEIGVTVGLFALNFAALVSFVVAYAVAYTNFDWRQLRCRKRVVLRLVRDERIIERMLAKEHDAAFFDSAEEDEADEMYTGTPKQRRPRRSLELLREASVVDPDAAYFWKHPSDGTALPWPPRHVREAGGAEADHWLWVNAHGEAQCVSFESPQLLELVDDAARARGSDAIALAPLPGEKVCHYDLALQVSYVCSVLRVCCWCKLRCDHVRPTVLGMLATQMRATIGGASLRVPSRLTPPTSLALAAIRCVCRSARRLSRCRTISGVSRSAAGDRRRAKRCSSPHAGGASAAPGSC